MTQSVKSGKVRLQVCTQQRYAPNPVCCANDGSHALLDALKLEVENNQLDIEVVPNGCLLRCDDGPNIKLLPSNRIWSHVSIETIPDIISTCKKYL